MPSASLCFNIPLFKKQSKRFWPLWSLYFLLHIMLLPMYMLMQAQTHLGAVEPLTTTFRGYLASMSTYGSLWINFIFCILVAMAIWSYLYHNRSVSMIHALPLTRGTLFLTNYLTGLLFVIAPSVIVSLLTLGVEAFVGAVTLKAVLLWLLFQILFSVFFFSFATLFAFVTGHILALPVFYGVFSFLTAGISMLLDSVFAIFVYGYSSSSLVVLDWFRDWMSPVFALMQHVQPVRPLVSEGVLIRPPMEVSGLGTLVTYAVVGLLFALLAYLLYRRRNLELAGEVITVSCLQPIFKYGVALCAGLTFGMIFYQLFQEVFSQGIGSLLFFMLLWAAIGYYAAEMMLKKSFRVFRQGAPGVVALLLIITASLLAMEYDITGYEKSIPDAQEIQHVLVSGWESSNFEQPEDIAAIIAMHETFVKEKAGIEAEKKEYDTSIRENNESYYTAHDFYSMDVQYTLTDGSIFRRSYSLPVNAETIAQKDSLVSQYETLINRPAVRLESIFSSKEMKRENLLEIRINVPDYAKQAPGKSQLSGVRFEADPYGKDAKMTLTGEAAQAFYAAVREDITASRLGYVFLGSNFNPDYPKINCLNTIYFTFRPDYNDKNSGTIGTNQPNSFGIYRSDDKNSRSYYEQEIDLQTTATSTMAVLEQCGLVRGVHILTLEQAEKAGYLENHSDKYAYEKYGYAPSTPTSETSVAAEAGEPVVVSP